MHKPLKHYMQDSAGKKAPTDLVGRYFHPKTGNLYRVVDVAFDAERERWMVLYVMEGGGPFCSHLPEDFTREGRFLKVATKNEGDDE